MNVRRGDNRQKRDFEREMKMPIFEGIDCPLMLYPNMLAIDPVSIKSMHESACFLNRD
jgi:hypothetical protein